MVETVVSMELPVDEKLTIRKNRIMPAHPTGNEKRIAIVTGTHGDELEGQFVCYELLRRLKAEPGYLKGIVEAIATITCLYGQSPPKRTSLIHPQTNTDT